MTSILVAAGVAMVAITSVATVILTAGLQTNGYTSLGNFFLMVACSSSATVFVLSHTYSELKARERHASVEARTDALTGLQNRKALNEELNQLVLQSQTLAGSGWLGLIDLNNFKNVNDSLGHEKGDELLMHVAKRLLEIVPANEAFRLGGDEFAVVFRNLTKSDAEDICRRLYQNVARSYDLVGTYVAIGCSIGLAEVEVGLTSSDLMRRADLAMYKAKKSRSIVEAFDLTMRDELVRTAELCKRLPEAFENEKAITLKYQPIISRDGEIEALEVFVCWRDQHFGFISPYETNHIGRLTQQIDNLSFFAISRSFSLLQARPGLSICINIEAMQVLDTRFAEALKQLVISSRQDTSNFQLEIDEAEWTAHGPKCGPVLRGLADVGFTIAVDNFGVGSSSLKELKSFGVTAVKFDQSFLTASGQTSSIALLQASVKLAKTLGMEVTCKGVNSLEDEVMALQAGCDYLQGSLYGRPDNAVMFLRDFGSLALKATGSGLLNGTRTKMSIANEQIRRANERS
ncbi:EAL domain-containing protein [Altererythrobacter sp. BO-6]|uniref:EAL domain-containing protein n=1 Tax=Altererythrobacter sp. BO-6 TaxID=2604537 RepID=UPI0019D1C6E3|nr:EAL domain-containing protein [Altererythrobacter sp. BO-6]